MDDEKIIYNCEECGGETEYSHYRENENETVCEDCYTEWLAEHMGIK